MRDMTINQQKLRSERDYFVRNVQDKIEFSHVNGHPQQKVNGILNMSFEMVDNESLLMLLDMEGVAVSIGSACTSNSAKPSHVLKAMGLEDDIIKSSIRISFGKNTSRSDLDYVIEVLEKSVSQLRSISAVTKAGRR